MFKSPLCPECVVEAVVDCVEACTVLALDPRGQVMLWSASAKRMFEYEPSEIVGRHLELLWPEEDPDGERARAALVDAARLGRVEHEGTWLRGGGARFSARSVITAVQDGFEDLAGFAVVVIQRPRSAAVRRRGDQG